MVVCGVDFELNKFVLSWERRDAIFMVHVSCEPGLPSSAMCQSAANSYLNVSISAIWGFPSAFQVRFRGCMRIKIAQAHVTMAQDSPSACVPSASVPVIRSSMLVYSPLAVLGIPSERMCWVSVVPRILCSVDDRALYAEMYRTLRFLLLAPRGCARRVITSSMLSYP